ncbi:protein NETWORKED 3C-like [Primulina huaijiensis]|uniref:protein NETWORKED 3C-like n=1 Tax=Primulina huaijiensis TaxID=1492673 RepID=UPI003CC7937F
MELKNKGSSHWWWLDSPNKTNLNRSPWLQSTLSELDEKTKMMLKLIEEDADSFAQRSEMYFKKRPELISMVEDFYRNHRSLAERYDSIKPESGTRLQSPWSSPLCFTKYRLEKSLSLTDKAYDSYSEVYGPEETDESEVEDPEEEEMVQENIESEAEEVSSVAVDVELMRLRAEVEKLREEKELNTKQLSQKDEEKREVIRQLSLAIDSLKEENTKLRKIVAARASPKKECPVEFKNTKGNFLGRLFNGFAKTPANIVAL